MELIGHDRGERADVSRQLGQGLIHAGHPISRKAPVGLEKLHQVGDVLGAQLPSGEPLGVECDGAVEPQTHGAPPSSMISPSSLLSPIVRPRGEPPGSSARVHPSGKRVPTGSTRYWTYLVSSRTMSRRCMRTC